jgi:hypothetical protein
MADGRRRELNVLPPQAYLGYLSCPHDCRGELVVTEMTARCRTCHREFAIGGDGILESVRESELDEETARELRGHEFSLTPLQVEQLVRKERAMLWRSYYSRNRMRMMQYLAEFLESADCRQVFFLGAGTGREIEYLLSFRKLHTVFCFDLSHTALRIIPARLKEYDLGVGLFTADLQCCPVVSRDMPVVVVNALHHTRDMHTTLEHLLDRQYENLFIVEPTDNFLIRTLARLGWARWREYSGVIPGRLELPHLKAMCGRHGYQLRSRTGWEFPRDYYRRLFGHSRWAQQWFFRLLDVFSSVTSVAGFGNFSVVHLSKLPIAKDAGPVPANAEGGV